MTVEIKNRYTGEIIATGETLKEAAEKPRANLSGANLSGADLSGANLSRANLSRATHALHIPVIADIHRVIYEAASQPEALDMSRWHKCETTHCRAGWTIVKAGEAGLVLESVYGPSVAAALIYVASDPSLDRIPNWHDSNEEAMADMARLAGVAQ